MKEIKEILDSLTDKRKDACLIIYDCIQGELKSKPGSTRHHHIEVGGLYRHIREVMNIALAIYDLNPSWYNATRDAVAIIAFVHDFNKVGKYVDSEDWMKQERYGSRMFMYAEGILPINETAEVLDICGRYGIFFSREEINALTFFHGGWAADAHGDHYKLCPLAVLGHAADMLSMAVFGDSSKIKT